MESWEGGVTKGKISSVYEREGCNVLSASKKKKGRQSSTKKCNSPVPMTGNGRVYINRLSLLVISNKPSIYVSDTF